MWLKLMVILMMTTLTIAQKCSLDSSVAMCVNEGWTKVPTGHQERVEILSLSENNIREINDGDLDHFERLTNLNIDNCKLETVGRTAFKHLQKLSYIDLSHNRLTYIGNDIFEYNTKLAGVVLSYNQLQPHKSSPFLISASVESLRMKNCGIEEISSDMFSRLIKLRLLDLSDNNILTVSEGAFSHSRHLDEVLVDRNVFVAPVFSKIRSNAVTVNFSTYNEQTTDIKKETPDVLSTPVTTFQSSHPLSTIQPTTNFSSFSNAMHTTTVATHSISTRDDPKAEPVIVHVNVISRENDTKMTLKETSIFGASIGHGEMYTIMAVSMLVGAGLCYALIQICRKRRSNVSNRDDVAAGPPQGFVGRGPDSASLARPVVYKIVPQYELEYLNDMYELPRTDTHTRHSFVPPVQLSVPPYNPPVPPRPPRRSVPSYHEYESIQTSSSEMRQDY